MLKLYLQQSNIQSLKFNTMWIIMKTEIKDAFIPSDFIMSSIDIANAINMNHDNLYQKIGEYIGYEAIERGYFYPVSFPLGNYIVPMYLLDLDAVIEISETIEEVEDCPDAKRTILQKYFELAYCCKTISQEIYLSIANKIHDDQIRKKEFLNKMWSCVNFSNKTLINNC